MNATQQATLGYAAATAPVASDRSTEQRVIAQITRSLKNAAAAEPADFAALVLALHDNRSLWTLLATDVADPENALPKDLRARIFYLAEFTQAHTAKVLRKEADVAPLIEINTAVLHGLRGEGSATGLT